MHQRPEPEISAFDTKNRALGLGYDILALFAEQWCPTISVLGLSALRIGQVAEELTARVHHQQIVFCFKRDRKSTRLNSSHVAISYAVFCLKKKKNIC